MRTEKEIGEKIDSLLRMLANVKKDAGSETADRLITDIQCQIDMLLWVLKDNGGLPPLDEDGMYSCYTA